MNRYRKAALISAATLAILYIVSMFLYYITSEPNTYCGSCHYIKPYVQSWEQSAHQSVHCFHCHEFRGPLGKIEAKARGLNYLYLVKTNQHTIPLRAKVFDQNCLACHLGDYRQFPDATKLTNESADHYTLIKEGRPCSDCHAVTGHLTKLHLNPDLDY